MANAPELRPELQMFWEAFEELSTCRGYIGFSGLPGPIPWTAIERYASKHGFVREHFDDLVTIIRAVDDEFRLLAMAEKPDGKPTGVPAEDGVPSR